jgi:NADPH:quinone reductase-like Zn-dependent oxidoreductase
MKAIVIEGQSDARTLALRDVPEPAGGPKDLVVRVRAAGINRADLWRHASHYSHAVAPVAPVAGLEFAGEVIATGADVVGFAVGDRVMAMSSGAYAEVAKVDYRIAMHVPAQLNWEEASATVVSFVTAHDALVTNGAFQAGEQVLVQGAASGAGIATVQIAKLLGASRIFGTSSSAAKLSRLGAMGLDGPINGKTESFPQVVRAATDGRGVDVIIDNVGRGTLGGHVDAAAIMGRIVSVGRLGGNVDEVNLDEFARKRLKLIGVTFRTRTITEHSQVVRAFVTALYPALADGRLKPVVDRSFPLAQADQAQDYMRGDAHFGKLVLIP